MQKPAWRRNRKFQTAERIVSEEEWKAVIDHLIHERQQARDQLIDRLKDRTAELKRELRVRRREMLLEEIGCFKDIIALHQQAQEEHDE